MIEIDFDFRGNDFPKSDGREYHAQFSVNPSCPGDAGKLKLGRCHFETLSCWDYRHSIFGRSLLETASSKPEGRRFKERRHVDTK